MCSVRISKKWELYKKKKKIVTGIGMNKNVPGSFRDFAANSIRDD